MYGKSGNFGENSNGTVHASGNFPEKSNTFQGITFFLSYRNNQNFLYHLFGLPVPGFMSRRSEIFSRYFVNGTTQSHSCFRCQKKYQYHLTKNFHQNFCTNGSWTPVLALGLICEPNAWENNFEFYNMYEVMTKPSSSSIPEWYFQRDLPL